MAETESYEAHDPGPGHPECIARLGAVADGMRRAGVTEAFRPLPARDATRDELTRVHEPALIDRLVEVAARGGGALDPDTLMSPDSWMVVRDAWMVNGNGREGNSEASSV